MKDESKVFFSLKKTKNNLITYKKATFLLVGKYKENYFGHKKTSQFMEGLLFYLQNILEFVAKSK